MTVTCIKNLKKIYIYKIWTYHKTKNNKKKRKVINQTDQQKKNISRNIIMMLQTSSFPFLFLSRTFPPFFFSPFSSIPPYFPSLSCPLVVRGDNFPRRQSFQVKKTRQNTTRGKKRGKKMKIGESFDVFFKE